MPTYRGTRLDLVAVDGAVDAGVEVGGLVVREPSLVDVVGIDVGGTCVFSVQGDATSEKIKHRIPK